MNRLLAASTLLFAASAFAAGAPNLTGNWTLHNSIAGNESSRNLFKSGWPSAPRLDRNKP